MRAILLAEFGGPQLVTVTPRPRAAYDLGPRRLYRPGWPEVQMEQGDLILTSSWIWRDHGDHGDEPSVRLDCTDTAFSDWGVLLPGIQKVTSPQDLAQANPRRPAVRAPALPWAGLADLALKPC